MQSQQWLVGTVSFLVVAGAALAQRPLMGDATRRVFITDSKSWEVSGGFGGTTGRFGGATRGGARPQTAEIIKTFGQRCPGVTVTMKQDRADFVVLLDHEGGKGWGERDNKVAVFNKAGDSIFSKSTRSLGSAVQDACVAIMRAPLSPADTDPAARGFAPDRPAPPGTAKSEQVTSTQRPNSGPDLNSTTLVFKSTPDGAEITVDGKFFGSTPSTVRLVPGDHTIQLEKAGFKPWQRTVTVNPGAIVTIDAALTKQE